MAELVIKKTSTYEAVLYIGSKQRYHGESFTKDKLIGAIGRFQDHTDDSMPVRVSDCCYVKGQTYREEGWEVSAITYPNRPQPIYKVDEFMEKLAEHLLFTFNQNRITVRRVHGGNYFDTVMYEQSDAETTHEIK